MIPVSYKFDFLCPAFSFDTIEDLSEIYAYLNECDEAGLEQAYRHFINCYLDNLK
jgi:protoheme ferro-lyase